MSIISTSLYDFRLFLYFILVYSSAWQPPELGVEQQQQQQQHPLDNEKIDIWGVGAVMLSVLSSIFIEPGEKFEELLQDIKQDPKALDETCEQLLEVSSLFVFFYISQHMYKCDCLDEEALKNSQPNTLPDQYFNQ